MVPACWLITLSVSSLKKVLETRFTNTTMRNPIFFRRYHPQHQFFKATRTLQLLNSWDARYADEPFRTLTFFVCDCFQHWSLISETFGKTENQSGEEVASFGQPRLFYFSDTTHYGRHSPIRHRGRCPMGDQQNSTRKNKIRSECQRLSDKYVR